MATSCKPLSACTSSAYMLLSTVKPLSAEAHAIIEMIKISKVHKLQAQIREMLRDKPAADKPAAAAKSKKQRSKLRFQLLPTIYEEDAE